MSEGSPWTALSYQYGREVERNLNPGETYSSCSGSMCHALNGTRAMMVATLLPQMRIC